LRIPGVRRASLLDFRGGIERLNRSEPCPQSRVRRR